MTINKPTASDVGTYYDTMGPFYQTLWGNSIHFGYWPDPADASVSMSQAQIFFTDLLIESIGVSPGHRVLDVGCGTGRPGLQLAEKAGVEVVGITVSQTQVATANEQARALGLDGRARFELVDAMQLPYEDASFDGAWAFESIFHVPSRVQVFSEMARVVRSGGRIVVADFVTLRPLTQEEIDITYPAFAATEIGSLDAYIGDLKAAGLINVNCRDVTVNTIRPSNRATLGAMRTDEAQQRLREVYGAEMTSGFLSGWQTIQNVNETLSYVVLTGVKP
jgi:27-O-demethylrifamycin SV methyltransferase